jgi:hypothetical protein
MAIDHEAHKIRIKAVSDRMNHPIEYNDAGAPSRMDYTEHQMQKEGKEEYRKMRRDVRMRNMITGGR